MRALILVLAVLAAAAGGVALAAGGSSRAQAADVLTVKGSIVALVGDGPLVVVHSQDAKGCHGLAFWNVSSHKLVSVKGLAGQSCDPERTFAEYIGFAGGRVVWTNNDQGRYPICSVYTATVAAPTARRILECPSDSETGEGAGQDVGSWAGDGPLLVGNSVWGESGCSTDCGGGEPSLVRVGPGGLSDLRAGDSVLYVRSVDAGRIVVLRDTGDVAVLDRTGRVLRVLAFKRDVVQQTALEGNDLVVKKATAVEVYNAGTGTLRKTWKVRPGSTLTDVHAGIAVLLRAKQVQLLRLTDGRGDAYSLPGYVANAALEPEGLTYAYDLKSDARVVFVPFARVSRRLR